MSSALPGRVRNSNGREYPFQSRVIACAACCSRAYQRSRWRGPDLGLHGGGDVLDGRVPPGEQLGASWDGCARPIVPSPCASPPSSCKSSGVSDELISRPAKLCGVVGRVRCLAPGSVRWSVPFCGAREASGARRLAQPGLRAAGDRESTTDSSRRYIYPSFQCSGSHPGTTTARPD